MSTDGDLSKGSGTDEGPDEFDSVVLDENFIKGGVSEASLRRYQVVREHRWERPPTRPSSASPLPANPLSADQQSPDADRPGAGSPPTALPGSGPTGAGPAAHLGTGERFSSGGFEHGRPRSTGLLVGAAALVVALVVLTGLIRLGRGSSGSAGNRNMTVAAQAGPGGQSVLLTPSLPPGSCFNLPADSSATNLTVAIVNCSTAHQLELVDLQQGTGANDQYPTQAMWSSTAYHQCSADLQTYTGKSASSWPVSLSPNIIPPTQASWSTGGRTIYCVAVTQPSGTGSVRGLGGSRATPTG